jgi:pimeloyl-ACP methyl ester carboxylesterase
VIYWGGAIGLRVAVEMADRVDRIVALDTGLFTGHQHMNEAWMAFRNFVERTEDLPVGLLVRRACKDEGHTLAAVVEHLNQSGVAAVVTAALVDKDIGRPRPVRVDEAALRCPDRFLFGHGFRQAFPWLMPVFGAGSDSLVAAIAPSRRAVYEAPAVNAAFGVIVAELDVAASL